MKVKVQCPAKVNLSLKITGKRPDGFHNIESIMQTISLYDYLTIEVKPSNKFEIKLSGNNPDIPYDERNLVYKAAKLFFENLHNCLLTHIPSPVERGEVNIHIEKNIPVAAGLAGGSTDAAGTIFGLNEIFDKPFSKNELHKMCSNLGSDLNVCLQGGKLFCTGRGEIVEPMEYKEFTLSLIKPTNLGISAKEAYTKFAIKNIPHSQGARELYSNDLEWAIIDDYPQLQKIKKLYPNSVMSGSGSTYFILNETFENLEGYQTFNNLKSEHKGCYITKRS